MGGRSAATVADVHPAKWRQRPLQLPRDRLYVRQTSWFVGMGLRPAKFHEELREARVVFRPCHRRASNGRNWSRIPIVCEVARTLDGSLFATRLPRSAH